MENSSVQFVLLDRHEPIAVGVELIEVSQAFPTSHERPTKYQQNHDEHRGAAAGVVMIQHWGYQEGRRNGGPPRWGSNYPKVDDEAYEQGDIYRPDDLEQSRPFFIYHSGASSLPARLNVLRRLIRRRWSNWAWQQLIAIGGFPKLEALQASPDHAHPLINLDMYGYVDYFV